MLKNTINNNVIYANILASDGTLRRSQGVTQDTPGALRRDYETSDGKKGTKYELVYTELSGIISDVTFYEGDYGKNLLITITDGDETPVILSVQTSNSYGEDVMKKLPSIDLAFPVILKPYSMVADNGKTRRGISVIQNGKKIQNHFFDFSRKENLHGYPDIPVKINKKTKEKEALSKEEWKIYFAQCRVFLIDYIDEHIVIPFNNAKIEKANREDNEIHYEPNNLGDIPF